MRLDPKRDQLLEEGRISGGHHLDHVDAEPVIENVAVDLAYRALISIACAQRGMLVGTSLPFGHDTLDHCRE
ncbi:MAG: hypothetical protein QHC89_16265 [Bosea sp. (in: a-proteobacteria)]|nr:hypothetical protein [Bosea sp. (in: a-proteobacteria)]